MIGYSYHSSLFLIITFLLIIVSTSGEDNESWLNDYYEEVNGGESEGLLLKFPTFQPTMSCGPSTPFPTIEYNALYELYQATHGDSWEWESDYTTNGYPWNFTGYSPSTTVSSTSTTSTSTNVVNNPCIPPKWQGITCTSSCNVKYLELIELNLEGTLPLSIGQFSQLTVLWISNNRELTGPIPHTIANLTNIQMIELFSNLLTGTIPLSLYQLKHVTTLYLYDNLLTGSLPQETEYVMSTLALTLNNFGVEQNMITGSIPDSFGLFSKLQNLYLQSNLLEGSLPLSLSQCGKLLNLEVNSNHLTGNFPSNLTANWIHLHTLFLSDNFFTGVIPSNVNVLQALFALYFDGNLFSGTIPATLTQLSFLRLCFLNANHLTGTIPSTIGQMTEISQLMLFSNDLTGSIPDSLIQLTHASKIYLFYNRLTGTIPDGFTQTMTDLVEFQLDFNLFTGTIPDNIHNLRLLTKFYLGDNLLTGTIPAYLTTGPDLLQISLDYNEFTGTIPSTLFVPNSTIYLDALYFQNNQFTGTIPDSIQFATKLEAFLMQSNYFTGTIPLQSFTNMSDLFEFAIAYNYFSGSLGSVLHTGNKTKLTIILAQDNFLTGSINELYDTSYQHQVSVVDISNNMFTGKLTNNLFANTHLFFFAAATNCITGRLPTTTTLCTEQGTTLTALILDGIQSSNNCQLKLFPSSSLWGQVHTYGLKHPTSGSLPSCLLSSHYMKVLTTLHLSGIGLVGEINLLKSSSSEEVDRLPPSLVDLTLSHNRLRGKIPEQLQSRNIGWQSLDLSFNLFSGEISENITMAYGKNDNSVDPYHTAMSTSMSMSSDTSGTDDSTTNGYSNSTDGVKNSSSSLSLQLNRLSGSIPSRLLSLQDIDILSGNMFSCPFTTTNGGDDTSYLPQHDKDTKSYECGSSSVNVALYLFLSLVGAILVLVVSLAIALRCGLLGRETKTNKSLSTLESKDDNLHSSEIVTMRSKLQSLWQEFYLISIEKEEDSTTDNTKKLHLSMSEIQAYVAMSSDVRRWILVTVFAFSIVMIPIYVGFNGSSSMYTHRYAWQLSAAFLTGLAPSVVICLILTGFALLWYSDYAGRLPLTRLQLPNETMIDQTPNDENKNENKKEKGIKYWKLVCLLFINAMVVLGINMLYVYAILQDFEVSTKALISFALSFFKIGWNWISMRVLDGKYLLHNLPSSTNGDDPTNDSPSSFCLQSMLAYLTDSWISFTTPTIIEDKQQSIWLGKCRIWVSLFNNIAVPCLAVTFINPDCFYYILVTPPEVSTTISVEYCQSYNVAFGNLYCYHKSIKEMRTTYLPPFVYNYQCSSALLVNFASVLILRYLLGSVCMPLLKVVIEERKRRIEDSKKNTIKTSDCNKEATVANGNGNEIVSQTERDTVFRNIASYPTYSIFLVTDIAILLTFGVIFPPLAIVGACCICCHVSCLRWNLCKITLQVQKQVLQTAMSDNIHNSSTTTVFQMMDDWWKRINQACHTSIRIVQEGYWTMLWIAPIFWSGYLFDMLGDDMGYVRGLVIMIVMIMVSVVLYQKHWPDCCIKKKRLAVKEDGKNNRTESLSRDNNYGKANGRLDSVATVAWRFISQDVVKTITYGEDNQEMGGEEIELQTNNSISTSGHTDHIVSDFAPISDQSIAKEGIIEEVVSPMNAI